MEEMQGLKGLALRRLRDLLIPGQSHVSRAESLVPRTKQSNEDILSPPEFDKDNFHVVLSLPLGKTRKLAWIHLVINSANCSAITLYPLHPYLA